MRRRATTSPPEGLRRWSPLSCAVLFASGAACEPFDWGLPPRTPQTPAEAAAIAEAHPELARLTFALAPVDPESWDCGPHRGVRRYVRGLFEEKLVHAGLRVVDDPRAANVLLLEHREPKLCTFNAAPSEWTLGVKAFGVKLDELHASCAAAEVGGDACNPMDALVKALLASPKLAEVGQRVTGAAPTR